MEMDRAKERERRKARENEKKMTSTYFNQKILSWIEKNIYNKTRTRTIIIPAIYNARTDM